MPGKGDQNLCIPPNPRLLCRIPPPHCRTFTAGMPEGGQIPTRSHRRRWQKQGTRRSRSLPWQRATAAFPWAGICHPGPASIPQGVQSIGYLRPVSGGALAEVGHVRSGNVPHGRFPQQPPG